MEIEVLDEYAMKKKYDVTFLNINTQNRRQRQQQQQKLRQKKTKKYEFAQTE